MHAVTTGPEAYGYVNLDNYEVLRKTNPSAYTVACMLSEKGRKILIETGTLDDMLEGGIESFYEKYSSLVKGLNLQLPTPEIVFEDMGYSVRVPIVPPTNILKKMREIVNFFQPTGKKSILKQVLYPMTGVIKPGSMTLVLGRPGSGKSSFLKALAGKLKTGNDHTLTGSILYSGLPPEDVHLSKFVGLIDQTDQHCPILTVRETIQFADFCLNGSYANQPEEVRGVAGLRTDLLLHILGLSKQANTVVGDEFLRGVSGGEKRRVTIGEMLVGGQSVFMCDEINTGLDSASLYDITQSLRSWTKILGGTVVAAYLQPPPEVVALFDNIILLSEGRMVYHGPRESSLEYFSKMGRQIHSDLDPAEFMIDVVCESGEEYEERYKSSDLYREINSSLDKQHEFPLLPTETVAFREYFAITKLMGSKKNCVYSLTFYESLLLLSQRQIRVLFRDKSLFYGRLLEGIIIGILLGTLYYQVTQELYMRMFYIVFAILQRQAWQQITIAFQIREIFYKQRSRNFYPTLAFGIAENIVQIPINIIISLAMGIPVYFISGLSVSADLFFIFILVLIVYQHAIQSLFAFLSAISPSITVAQALVGTAVALNLLFSGNIILHDLIPDYWIWMYWFMPISWGLRSLMINEYYYKSYSPEETNKALTTVQIHYGSVWRWYGIFYLFGMYVFFIFMKSIALHYLSFETKKRSSQGQPIDSNSINKIMLGISREKWTPDMIPVYLSVKNLGYSVKIKGKTLQLLTDITVHFSPSTMTGLMGCSGAGKTTLLDVIAGRKTEGVATGDIYVNGELKDPATFPRVSAYCEQIDIHSELLTVRESLIFSAMLRLPSDMSYEDKLNIVDETVELLGLRGIANCIVGTLRQGGISIEQRKRLTVGVELVANPPILFLDEPTSGLDAKSAVMVMQAVKNLTKLGKTIVCTIHQPNTQLFFLFDNILLLQRGGRVAYFDKLEKESHNMIDYFNSVTTTPSYDKYSNPANFALDRIGTSDPRENKEMIDYAKIYEESELKKKNDDFTNKVTDPSFHTDHKLPEMIPIATSVWNQIWVTSNKRTRIYWRSTNYNLTRLILFPLLAIIFGTTFYQLQYSTQQKVTSQIGLIYVTMDFVGVANMMTVIEITCAERAVYYRERSSNMYGPMAYAVSMIVAEIPYVIVLTGIFLQFEYWLVGLENGIGSFCFYWLIFILYGAACTFYGQLFSVLLPNVKVANVAVGFMTCLLNLFSGYLVYLPKIPSWYYWATYIFPSRYALSSLVSSQVGICSDDKSENGCSTIVVNNVTETIQDYVARVYDFTSDWRYYNTLLLLVIWAVLQVCIYLALRYVCHIKR